jgi:hypothetical protein
MPIVFNPSDVVLSVVASWLVEKAKHWDAITWLTPETTGRIQKILTLASLLLAIGQNWLNHSLANGVDWKVATHCVAMVSWVVAYKAGVTKAKA